jgi:pSer/pThr/pTyr-binding forkhead associated (FHA) protein
MDKMLEGNLARFEVPDVLAFLNMGRRTGLLAMERADQETKLFIRDGNPVFATSSRDELRLGSMLIRVRKVTAADLDRALDRHRGRGYRLGQALLAERLLSEAELASFLKVQISEVIFDTFEWKDGVFTFWDRVPPPATAVTLLMDLQNLIMEGSRRIDERGRLAEVFPDKDMLVEAMANPERVKHSVTMTPEEWKVFFLVDGRRSLNEICRLAGNPDEMTTLEILHRLVMAKFAAVLPQPIAPAPAPAPATSANPMPLPVEGKLPSGGTVQFQSGVRAPRQQDDTHEIVTKNAVQYVGQQGKFTASRLLLMKDGGGETSFPLTRDTYTVGRHRNNDIVISDPKVSSFHARLDRSPDAFVVVDLKSRNGSYINGRRVETGPLKNGDELRMGPARLVYRVDEIG